MANYSITIGGGDVTDKVPSSSVFHRTAKNQKPSSFNFSLVFSGNEAKTATSKYVKDGYIESGYIAEEEVSIPSVNQTIEFYIDDVLQFGGKIMNINRELSSSGMSTYRISCQDYSRLAQMGDPVAEIYRDKTVNEIIFDIVVRYDFYSQFDIQNINCDIVIDYFFVDHKTLWEVLTDLSSRTSFDFYIDDRKKIYFHSIGTISGELITETNSNFISNTFSVKEDISRMFNFLIVQGGEYDGSELIFETVIADGSNEINIKNRYSGVTVSADGAPQSVGVYGLDNEKMPDTYNCLYDYSGRKIIFDDTTKPASGASIVVSGYQKLKVIVKIPEASSISKYGIIPKKIKDITLKTKDSAFQYAKAQLLQYATELESGSFKTRNTTYRAGQRISVDYMGEISSFDVQSTSTVFIGENIQETTVTLATAEVVDAINIMTDLINQKNTSESAEDILDVLRMINEEVNIQESVSINPNTKTFDIDISIKESVSLYQDIPIHYVYGNYQFQEVVELEFQDSSSVEFQDSTSLNVIDIDYKRNAIYSGSTYG